jgi:hypothetical protein
VFRIVNYESVSKRLMDPARYGFFIAFDKQLNKKQIINFLRFLPMKSQNFPEISSGL